MIDFVHNAGNSQPYRLTLISCEYTQAVLTAQASLRRDEGNQYMESQVSFYAHAEVPSTKRQSTITFCLSCRLSQQAHMPATTAQFPAQTRTLLVLQLAHKAQAQQRVSVRIHMVLWQMKPSALTLHHTAWVQAERHWQAAALLTLKPQQIVSHIMDWIYTALLMTMAPRGLQVQPQHLR